MILVMIVWLRHLLGWLVGAFHSRQDLILENLALRPQLLVLHAQRPRRRFSARHKLFWVYCEKPVRQEIRALIFQMVAENPTWGAPRIHGELLMLGFKISEATVSRWIRRAPRSPQLAHCWLTFLRNHREAIAAMDFFTVPTLTFGILYCFFVIAHDRRRILHSNVTPNPQAFWVAVQLRETWIPQPLAKRSCRALGGQRTARPLGSCDGVESATSETVAARVRPLSSRRQDASRAREGYSRRSNCRVNPSKREQGYLPAATGRLASSLCCRSLAPSSCEPKSFAAGCR